MKGPHAARFEDANATAWRRDVFNIRDFGFHNQVLDKRNALTNYDSLIQLSALELKVRLVT